MKLKWPLLFVLCVASAHAQMYRWVDANGKVNYSDSPPPSSAVKQQKKLNIADNTDNSGFTYALSEAVKNHPVTLYTSSNCTPCDDGRALLKKRGIPYSEKTVITNEDIAHLKQVGGDGRLPFLKVGRNGQTGFDTGIWNASLTSAGYPETSQLPPNYRFSAPEPAVPPPPVQKPTAPLPPTNTVPDQPASGSTLPGFRF
jgi:hypothetical protein